MRPNINAGKQSMILMIRKLSNTAKHPFKTSDDLISTMNFDIVRPHIVAATERDPDLHR